MKDLRGINQGLIDAFKKSKLYDLVKENSKDVFFCIRNNAIGLYYNADRIAMVSLNCKGELHCKINAYYKTGVHGEGETTLTSDELCKQFGTIKKNSDNRSGSKKTKTSSSDRCADDSTRSASLDEKRAQQALVYANNTNSQSKWICIDIEYKQSTKVQSGKKKPFTGRFDIIAISKEKPHRIAIIELKYNGKAIGGDSGVVKHLKDFYNFNDRQCIENLKNEIKVVLSNLSALSFTEMLPVINDIEKDFSEKIEFYMICLYDTKESTRGTVGGYLFKEPQPEWGTKRVSQKNAEEALSPDEYAILKNVKFLFKRVSGPLQTGIDDILDVDSYEN